MRLFDKQSRTNVPKKSKGNGDRKSETETHEGHTCMLQMVLMKGIHRICIFARNSLMLKSVYAIVWTSNGSVENNFV